MNCRALPRSFSARSRLMSPAWREGCAPSPWQWTAPSKLDPKEKPVTICSPTVTFTWLWWKCSATWRSFFSTRTNSRSAEKSALISYRPSCNANIQRLICTSQQFTLSFAHTIFLFLTGLLSHSDVMHANKIFKWILSTQAIMIFLLVVENCACSVADEYLTFLFYKEFCRSLKNILTVDLYD